MVVEPTQQDLLGGQLQQVVNVLAGFEQAEQFRVIVQRDLGHETNAHYLPNETEDQVLASLHNVARANVDDRAADSLGGIDGQVVVLGHLKRVQFRSPVDDTLINGVRHRVVDKLAISRLINKKDSQVIRAKRQKDFLL